MLVRGIAQIQAILQPDNHLESLLDYRFLCWSPVICICNRFPGEAEVATLRSLERKDLEFSYLRKA